MHENYEDTSLILFPWVFVVYLEVPHDTDDVNLFWSPKYEVFTRGQGLIVM